MSGALPLAACVFATIAFIAAYGHVVNDIFDVESDADAGKTNAMASWGNPARLSLCLALLAAGFIPALIAQFPLPAFLLILLNYLWPTLYSIPPVRFKERGIGGVILDAAGSHITPTLLVLAVFSPSGEANPGGSPVSLYLAGAAWASVLGVKGILYHQLADSENDRISSTQTWARSVGQDRIRRFLPFYNLAAELTVCGILVGLFSRWCQLGLFAFLLYLAIEIVKNRLAFEFALDQNPLNTRRSVPFANDLFYDSWFPLAVGLQLGLSGSAWIWLPFLQIVFFLRNYRILLLDLGSVAQNVGQRVLSR